MTVPITRDPIPTPIPKSKRGISFETGSTGLGLYFADIVARLHQAGDATGCIRLSNDSRLGGGCFTLELP